MSWVALRKELFEEIMNDPKYGRKFQKIVDEGDVKKIKKFVEKYCRKKGMKTIDL